MFIRPVSVLLAITLVAGVLTSTGTQRADAAVAALTATDLRVEGLTDPIGIDATYTGVDGVTTNKPRLTWIPASTVNGQAQTAYRVQVGTSAAALAAGTTIWDTGKVSGNAFEVLYGGPAVVSGGVYFWRVQIWDAQDTASPWSTVSRWRMGLLTTSAWKSAQWIGESSTSTAPREAVVLLRKQFANPKTVSSATLTIAGLGYHLGYVNGKPINDHLMSPPWTAYDKRINYVTTDVTGLLTTGAGAENAIGIALAGGWYDNQAKDIWDYEAASWVGKVRALVVLDLVFTDGTTSSIVSDGSWKSGTGEVVWSTSRGGEDIDHTKNAAGWNTVGFAAPWSAVTTGMTPIGTPRLEPMMFPPVRRAASPEAIEKTTTSAANATQPWTTFKLVNNTTGVPQLTLTGTAGTVVEVQVGEGLYAAGQVNAGQVDPAWHGLNNKVEKSARWQLSKYTLSGASGGEVFSPQFTYFAGQYITVKVMSGSLKTPPKLEFFATHNDVETTGTFTSSNTVLNQVHSAAIRTYLNNLQGAPLDSTQRERLGYGGDATATTDYAIRNFTGVDRILSDWVRTFGEQQFANGYMYWVAPSTDYRNDQWWSPWWPTASVLVPGQVAAATGDGRQLAAAYPAMNQWVDYLWANKLTSEKIYNFDSRVADHESPENTNGKGLDQEVQFNTLGVLAALRAAAETADLLGQAADASTYRSRFEEVRSAFNERWFNTAQHTYSANPSTGTFARASQSVLSVAVALGIPAASEDAAVYASLLDEIAHPTRDAKWADHQTTGIIATPYLYDLLADRGDAGIAVKMLTQTTFPSVAIGATSSGYTLWERIIDESYSHSHPAFGSVDSFLFEGLAGIDTDRLVSDRELTIAPSTPAGMSHASASQKTVLGTVASSWVVAGGATTYTISVPVGVTATVVLASAGAVRVNNQPVDPAFSGGRRTLTVGSGRYEIVSAILPTGPAHRIDDDSARLTYSGSWRAATGLRTEYWPGGRSHSTTSAGSTVSYRCESCSSMSWWSTTGRDRGLASVSVDGGPPVTVDTFGSVHAASSAVFSTPTLPAGSHTLTIQALGTKNPASTGTAVEVEAIVSNDGRDNLTQRATVWQGITDVTANGWGTWRIKDGILSTATPDVDNGYHSMLTSVQTQPEMLTFDLGSSKLIREVVLVPAHPVGLLAGYGYPTSFKIEVSNDPSFTQSSVFIDLLGTSIPNPGDAHQHYFGSASGQYVRISFGPLTLLPSGRYAVALQEAAIYGP